MCKVSYEDEYLLVFNIDSYIVIHFVHFFQLEPRHCTREIVASLDLRPQLRNDESQLHGTAWDTIGQDSIGYPWRRQRAPSTRVHWMLERSVPCSPVQCSNRISTAILYCSELAIAQAVHFTFTRISLYALSGAGAGAVRFVSTRSCLVVSSRLLVSSVWLLIARVWYA